MYVKTDIIPLILKNKLATTLINVYLKIFSGSFILLLYAWKRVTAQHSIIINSIILYKSTFSH